MIFNLLSASFSNEEMKHLVSVAVSPFANIVLWDVMVPKLLISGHSFPHPGIRPGLSDFNNVIPVFTTAQNPNKGHKNNTTAGVIKTIAGTEIINIMSKRQ
jgi:hypothetical protein